MTQELVLFERVSYRYESMSDLLLRDLSISFPPGWTGIVGANGAGKTTVLKLACGLLHPGNGHIRSPGHTLYCEQRTDHLPALLPLLIGQEDTFACRIKGQLGIEGDWASRWDSLSHGERKRAQIAVAVWQKPDVLALDEPTNHIDSDARKMLILALCEYRGIGLLVSHDRELLDNLCRQCLMLDPSNAIMRPGGYSKTAELRRVEQESRRFARQEAKREAGRLRAEARNRARVAAGSDRRVSKRGLARWDLDSRFRANRAMFTGKDTHAGQLLRQMRVRVRRAEEKLESIRVTKEYRLGVELRGERAQRDFLIRLKAEELPLGAQRRLVLPDLAVCPDDRIGLVGRNGAGKSTLIRHLVTRIELPPERFIYMPQEIDLGASRRILNEVRSLTRRELAPVMTFVSRLGSRPEKLLETDEPSPGELRKLLLALGVARHPWLIIMDEPTNHLDLPSIECLEEALADCFSAVVLVSHDTLLLQRLTQIRWHILPTAPDRYVLDF